MAQLSFNLQAYDAADIQVSLLDAGGGPFDLAAYLAAGGIAKLSLSLATGSLVRKGFSTTNITVRQGDPVNLATIHILGNQITTTGTYTGTLSADDDVWTVQATVTPTQSSLDSTSHLLVEQLPVYTSSTRPNASLSWDRRIILVKDPGQSGKFEYCRQNASGTYEWVSPAADYLVEVNSQEEENAAFAAGAKIVVRLDLL